MPEESTTHDLVELFLRSVEAFNRRDFDAVMSIYSREVVWDASLRDADRYESRAAWRSFLEEWQALYEEYTLDVEEIADLGNGVIFAVLHQKARPLGTHGYVEMRDAWAYVWEKGLIVHTTGYFDIDEARAAAERLAEERADG
jgi:ketosteroid isomerase-like protein